MTVAAGGGPVRGNLYPVCRFVPDRGGVVRTSGRGHGERKLPRASCSGWGTRRCGARRRYHHPLCTAANTVVRAGKKRAVGGGDVQWCGRLHRSLCRASAADRGRASTVRAGPDGWGRAAPRDHRTGFAAAWTSRWRKGCLRRCWQSCVAAARRIPGEGVAPLLSQAMLTTWEYRQD